MSINVNVRAEVVDVQTDAPDASDSFLVDTNVWFWTTYTRLSVIPPTGRVPAPYQVAAYPSYLAKAKSTNARIYWSGAAFPELVSLIERTEYDIFCKGSTTTSLKEFRHNLITQRANVVAEADAAWNQVETIGSGLALRISAGEIAAARMTLGQCATDAYDALALSSAVAEGVTQVLSDDADLVSIPGVRVFTANRRTIALARNAGRLVVR